MTVNDYRRTNQISTRPTTAETMPTTRRILSGVASALFIARRIQAGLAANSRPSSTKRIPTPMRKSANAMDLIVLEPPGCCCFYLKEGEAHSLRRSLDVRDALYGFADSAATG